MADAGLHDVLIAYPIVGELKLERLAALMDRSRRAREPRHDRRRRGPGARRRAAGRRRPGARRGRHRTPPHGTAAGGPSSSLALEVAGVPWVDVVGLLTHAGHSYRASDATELRRIAEREAQGLLETAERCARMGLEMREISVGSTPTARIVAGVPGVTEVRPGTYVFNDVQQLRLGVARSRRALLACS